MQKYTKDEIQKAIEAVYGKQKFLADKMGTSETALSNRIKRGSPKFIRELQVKYNVDFSMIVTSDVQILSKWQICQTFNDVWQIRHTTFLQPNKY